MGYQFRLDGMFLWITTACVGLAIERMFGAFSLALACGLLVIGTLVRILHVESVIVGAVAGFLGALIVFHGAASMQLSGYDAMFVTAGSFAYLACGVTVGGITVADHMIREGR